MKNNKTRLKNIAVYIGAVVFWILLWKLVSVIANRNLLITIPGPEQTVSALVTDFTKPTFIQSVGTSMLRIVIGYAAAVIIGLAGASMSSFSKLFDALSSPIIHLIRSVPVAAFIIVAWLWVPSWILPSVISCLMVIPIMWSHTAAGISQIDNRLIEMGEVFGMSKKNILFGIKIPLIMPSVRAGAVTGIGIAWKSCIAAEVICDTGISVGSRLHRAKSLIEYEQVFAITLEVVILSIILENVLKIVWKEKNYGNSV